MGEDAFSAGTPTSQYFISKRFPYVLPQKPRNKHLLATHDYYFMFKTFFSQMNNKVFFIFGDPSPIKRVTS